MSYFFCKESKVQSKVVSVVGGSDRVELVPCTQPLMDDQSPKWQILLSDNIIQSLKKRKKSPLGRLQGAYMDSQVKLLPFSHACCHRRVSQGRNTCQVPTLIAILIFLWTNVICHLWAVGKIRLHKHANCQPNLKAESTYNVLLLHYFLQ